MYLSVGQVPNDHISWMALWQDRGTARESQIQATRQEEEAQEASAHLTELQRADGSHLLCLQYSWLSWIPSASTDEIRLTCIL